MSSRKGQGPLLFTKAPVANNQEIFRSKEVEVESIRSKTFDEERVEIEVHKQEKVNHEKNHRPFKKVKSFKEMDLKERLEYLVNFPKVLPPVPCLFYTKNQNYHGYLSEYQDDSVTIQFHDQTTKTIPMEDLMDILMIGIRK